MNCGKSILLAATTLGAFGAGHAQAQTATATGITFLAPPATGDVAQTIFPDSLIAALGITADGRTVLTIDGLPLNSPNSENLPAFGSSTRPDFIHLWTDGVLRTVILNQPVPPEGRGNGFTPSSISGDGGTVIGSRAAFIDRPGGGTSSFGRVAVWTQATGVAFLPDVNPATREIVRSAVVNTNGTYFAVTSGQHPYLADGSFNPNRRAPRRAYRYSVAGGFEYLGSLSATISMTATAISGAGDVIAGTTADLAPSNIDPIEDTIISVGSFR
jgi:hypothetical protein